MTVVLRDARLRPTGLHQKTGIKGPITLVNCEVAGSMLGDKDNYVTVTDLELYNCLVGGRLKYVSVENCLIERLRTAQKMPMIAVCRFRHVTLRGKVGPILINGLGFSRDDPRKNRAIDERVFYRDVDWALDITEMDAADFSLKGTVPGKLIRHDPMTAGVITLDAAKSGRWRDIDFARTGFGHEIAHMIRRESPDDILVAPRTGNTAQDSQRVIAELRQRGLLLDA